jgi:hypothetical protein
VRDGVAGGAGVVRAAAAGEHQDRGHPEGCVDDGALGGGAGGARLQRQRQESAPRCYLAQGARTHQRADSTQQPPHESEPVSTERRICYSQVRPDPGAHGRADALLHPDQSEWTGGRQLVCLHFLSWQQFDRK